MHYVDQDDYKIDRKGFPYRVGPNSTHRRYRHSLEILKNASKCFEKENTQFAIALGDVIDTQAAPHKKNCKEESFSVLQAALNPQPWHLLIGNNDMNVFKREEILAKYIPENQRNDCSRDKLYYSFSPHERFRFIILDSFAISTFTNSLTSDKSKILLGTKNKNLRSPDGNFMEFFAQPQDMFLNLSDEEMRFVPYGGALGFEQLEWLEKQLKDAKSCGQKCILFSHLPCHANCCNKDSSLWDRDEVLSIIQDCGNVVAYFAGHDHDGGCFRDESGIYHLIPKAPIECEADEDSFGICHVSEDQIELNWTGATPRKEFCYPGHPWPDKISFNFEDS